MSVVLVWSIIFLHSSYNLRCISSVSFAALLTRSPGDNRSLDVALLSDGVPASPIDAKLGAGEGLGCCLYVLNNDELPE